MPKTKQVRAQKTLPERRAMRLLVKLFTRIHNVPDPGEVVRIAAEHEVNFLPPPG
jgi:hypothetical protein